MKTSTLDDIGDLNAPKGSKEWATAVVLEAHATLKRTESDAHHAGVWLKALRETEAWKTVGFLSWGAMLKKMLNISEQQADIFIRAKRGQWTVEQAKDLGPVAKHGGDRKTKEQGDNITLTERGTDQTYTLRRLLRDAPELFAKVESGELSANAAAIKAGFRSKTVTVPVDPERAARTILKHFTNEQVHELIERLA